jgi:hypothetical protein
VVPSFMIWSVILMGVECSGFINGTLVALPGKCSFSFSEGSETRLNFVYLFGVRRLRHWSKPNPSVKM